MVCGLSGAGFSLWVFGFGVRDRATNQNPQAEARATQPDPQLTLPS
jgi:hypothetical protein